MIIIKIKYDFHIHSCLSPCGDNDMTPENLVNMAKLCGDQVIALTDHNSCLNCPAALKAGKSIGLTVIPGMELTTSEEIHVVCLFEYIKNALEFSEFVYSHLPTVHNNPSIFGDQLIMNENDEVQGTVDKLLINATSISIMQIVSLMEKFGGFCFPAHIDRNSYSILSNLGYFPDDCGFVAAEISKKCDLEMLKQSHSEINGLHILRDSDSHSLDWLDFENETIDCNALSFQDIVDSIKH